MKIYFLRLIFRKDDDVVFFVKSMFFYDDIIKGLPVAGLLV